MPQKDLILQDWQDKIKGNLGKTEWITVFSESSAHHDISQGGFYSAFISNEKIEQVLKNYQWDLLIGNDLPGFCSYFKNGKEIIEYYRFSEVGIEPLVYFRSFYGVKDYYYEISEEFRLYFNLFEDRKSLKESKFIHIDDNGDEEEVILINNNEVKVKLKFLKEFLAVKKMHLAIYFEFMKLSKKTLNELKQKEINNVIHGVDYTYSIYVRDLVIGDTNSQEWLIGKKIISGLRDFKPNIFGQRDEKKYEDFIIGMDEDGKEILHTCKEEKLANFFGKNPGAPQYITPVFFKKEVLKKYYNNPEKYSVDDGYLHCEGLWNLRMDNNHPKYVVVFLGDLDYLHHKEQLYWKSFNVAHQGGISGTAWERGFEAKFTDPEQPDLYFKYKFEIFQKAWFKKFGWYLFKPLSTGDIHHFKSLHIPTTNDQKEFDEQVLSLTKMFIDSLNEKELAKGISIDKENPKGLDKLEYFLISKNVRFKDMFEFLRNLQSLRSTSVAHRKSEKRRDYQKVLEFFDFNNKELQEIFGDILIKAIWTLNSLEGYILTKR
jgi:hypothetical protein